MRVYYYFDPKGKSEGAINGNIDVLDDILKNQRIKISRISRLNDPFDFQVSFSPKESEAYISGFRKKFSEIDNEVGLVCFSTDIRNVLMWSHYAAKHTGFALELEVDENDERLMQVNYSTIAPEIFKVSPEDGSGCSFKNIHNVLRSKALDWAYEKEWRMILSYHGDDVVQDGVDEDGNIKWYLKLKADAIKAIYVGLKSTMSPHMVFSRMQQYNLDHIVVYKMGQARTGYSLTYERCDKRKEQIKSGVIACIHSIKKLCKSCDT